MSTENNDLIGGEIDATAVAAELRALKTQHARLLDRHREYLDALGRIGAAAGLLNFESLGELVEGVTKQLQQSSVLSLIAPAPAANDGMVVDERPVVLYGKIDSDPTGLVCDSCGADNATDLGDGVVLCDDCSGANTMRMS